MLTELRHLPWDGCFNARDLGGLPTEDGHEIRWGGVVRADSLDELSPEGWAALHEHGVRTVIDLRNDGERMPDSSPRPSDITTLHLPLDNIEDEEFWGYWGSGYQFGTPLFYLPHVERFPERSARVLAAIAQAPPGGVVFHCSIGRDRTGLVAILLLSLLGVGTEHIVADYALTEDRLGPLFAHRGQEDSGPAIQEFLAARGTSTAGIIRSFLDSVDRDTWMREGGLSEADLTALRARLLG